MIIPGYETVPASTREEALEKSVFQVGELHRVASVLCTANFDKTWWCHPVYELESRSEVRDGDSG